MATTQNSQLNSPDRANITIYDRIVDPALRADLQRIEERIMSYAGDVLDGWLGMAEEFHKAKAKLANNKSGQWTQWVEERFGGFIALNTANRLAEIGKTERDELATLRHSYFQKGTGIAAIAAYLAAPEPVQDLVRAGEVEPTQVAIKRASTAEGIDLQKAISAIKDAEEARKRAEDAEKRANDAAASLEAQLDQIRREAAMQTNLAVQEATAKLQREADEARHQAEMRQRDIEQAQREIQRAQSEWKQQEAALQARVTEAKTIAAKEERERAEQEFTEKMRKLEKQLGMQERDAMESRKRLNEINARLGQARDAVAIRAKWDILAAELIARLEDAVNRMPSVIDAEYFENHERTLVDSVLRRAETLVTRLKELANAGATVVDSRP